MSKPKKTNSGWAGTRITGGRISQEDPNTDLIGREWAEAAMGMLYTDDAVASAWEAVSATLLSARWSWEPGDPTSEFSKKLAYEANAMMGLAGKPGRMARGWEDIVAELILHEYIGFRYGEPIWEYNEGVGFDLVDIADRDPRVHDQWLIDGPRLLGVKQLPPVLDRKFGTKMTVEIPADELILLTRGKTGQNYEGRGLSRAAYFLWKLKTHVMDMISIGAERWAFSTPMLESDRQAAKEAGILDEEFNQQLESARDALEAFFAQEAAFLEGTPYVKFQEYGQSLNAAPMLEIVRHCDMSILRCFLVQFLALGISDTGSRSVGEVHETFFRRACINVLDRIASAMSGKNRSGGGVIGRWIEYNYGWVPSELYPKLKHSGLDIDRLMEVIPLLPELDLAAINALRSRGGLPHVEETEQGGATDAA